MSNVFTSKLLLISLSIAFLKPNEALKCYKCGVYSKPSFADCVTVDENTKVEECKEGEEYCEAIGLNHVRNETYSEYSNIRGCGTGKTRNNLCRGALNAYLEENIRNCHACHGDLCNNGPLLPGVTGGGESVETTEPSQPEPEPEVEGEAKVDSSGMAGGSETTEPSQPEVEGEAKADSSGKVEGGGSVKV